MSQLGDWFWPLVSAVLAVLWLWTLIRCQSKRSNVEPARSRKLLERAEAEDLLKVIYTVEAQEGDVGVEALAGALSLSQAAVDEELETLAAFGWIEKNAEGGLRMTDAGRQRATNLVRAHRLWERYLVEREGMTLDVVHAEAHQRERGTTPEEIERLDSELEHPAWDPHGHAIPAPSSRLPATDAHSLLEEAEPGSRFRVVQIDEEPSELLAQLIVLGLEPGKEVEVQAQDAAVLKVVIAGGVVPLANAVAMHIRVMPAPMLPVPLGELSVGARARVVEIQGTGKHQRRMLDIGFVPGAHITVVRKAPLGDPVAYRVKETAIALRREDAGTM